MPPLIQASGCAPKSADVLARIDAPKAKQVTAGLARWTELLRAAGNS